MCRREWQNNLSPTFTFSCSENGTISQPLSTERESSLELEDEKKIKIVWFILVSAVLTVLFLLNGICFFMWRFQKPVRPKIKKTYVVRKNLTPLTCRPSGAEQQCEITIENCCNMNVCDTVSCRISWIFFAKKLRKWNLIFSWVSLWFFVIFIALFWSQSSAGRDAERESQGWQEETSSSYGGHQWGLVLEGKRI